MPGIWIARWWLVTLTHVSLVLYPCSLLPPSLSHTDTFTLSPIALAFSLTFSLSHLTFSPLSPPPPIPLLSLSLMSLHEQVQLSMKLTGSELHSKNSGMKFIPLFLLCNHFSLIYDESHWAVIGYIPGHSNSQVGYWHSHSTSPFKTPVLKDFILGYLSGSFLSPPQCQKISNSTYDPIPGISCESNST